MKTLKTEYAHGRLVELRETAARINLILRDVSDRWRAASELYKEAVTIRDTGNRYPDTDGGRPVRRFPDAKRQAKNEETARDRKLEMDRLREERDRLQEEWHRAARLATAAEEYVKLNKLEAHDKPPAEESPFTPAPARDRDFVPVVSPGGGRTRL
ncbi:MAG: hypothetical protein Q8R92_10035 [Deltaproteobacteria bacterium]|nr:hypothetical protein [Deltaproteobacteria bacterium]